APQPYFRRALLMMRLTPATAMLVLLAMACGDRGADAPPAGTTITSKVKLRYHPPAGAVHRYALHQINNMKMEAGPMMGMGEQRLTLQMRLTQNVTGPVSGGTEVKVTFDSVQLEAPGIPADVMARELDQLRGLVSTVLFDE